MKQRALRWAAAAVALVLINTAASFHNVWPTPWITVRPELSVEAAAIVLAVIVACAWRLPTRRVTSVLAGLLLLLALARYMEVTAPALYGRAINLYWDAPHVPAVIAMVADAVPGWLLIVAGALVVGGLLALYFGFRWALTTVAATDSERPAIAALCVGLIGAYLIGYYASVGPILRWFSIPVTQTYTRQIAFVADAVFGEAEAAELPAADPLAGWFWPEPGTADVFVVFVESYGAVAYDAPDVAEPLAPHRRAFEAAVREQGGQVASAFITSPTFGGVSWLAHSSFMTGIDVVDSGVYNTLLTQQRETLVDRVAAGGYRTVALMPGLRGDWPEGSFYGFDRIYGEREIAYTGPEFGWWRVPDQFALARLIAAEVATSPRSPLMLFFPTINTHMPFRPTPPYQPDWERLSTSAQFPPDQLAEAFAAPRDLMDLRPAYAGALAYTFDYLAGFVASQASDDWLLVILGDHQPPASVAGEGARWDVPVHVAASDPTVLSPFLERGFVVGIEPEAEAIGRTYELGNVLLEALGAAHGSE